jgi:hypothetical protein
MVGGCGGGTMLTSCQISLGYCRTAWLRCARTRHSWGERPVCPPHHRRPRRGGKRTSYWRHGRITCHSYHRGTSPGRVSCVAPMTPCPQWQIEGALHQDLHSGVRRGAWCQSRHSLHCRQRCHHLIKTNNFFSHLE